MNKMTEVLILDDEINILHSLTRALRKETFGVFTTSNPEEALEVLKRENIKLVMSDHKMPRMEGVEFLRRAKGIKPQVIRILFTGHADIQIAEDAINKGEVYRFVNKPWKDDELKRIFRDAIRQFDLIAENQRLFALTQKQNLELEAANRQLQYLMDKQTEFTSTVSHELRTPLASMKMAADIIIRHNVMQKLDTLDIQLLNIVKSSIERLNRLINDILDLSKLEASNEGLEMQAHDLNRMILEIADLQTPLAKTKGLEIRLVLDSDLRFIQVNPDKMTQLLTNLINNAIKFTESGSIIVSSRIQKGKKHVDVRVEDTGSGIAAEDLPKLFQKFQQLGDESKRVGGTGLGLAICKEIAARHHGNISVESEVGKGSAFVLTLPLENGKKAAA